MKISQLSDKIQNNKVAKTLEKVLSSPYFAIVTAVVTVFGSLVGWELLTVWYACICGAMIMLFCKDVTPVLCVLLFMNVMVSVKHGPNCGIQPDYFTRPAVLAQAIVGVAMFAITIINRLVGCIVNRRFRVTPMFFGVCAFALALIVNGLFYTHYYYMNALYGLGLAAILIIVFVFVSGNVSKDGSSVKNLAFYFIALSLSLTVQLIFIYCTNVKIENGSIDRYSIRFGWGSYNQFGMLMTMCVPSWFYLATKYKHGWSFLIGGAIMCGVVVFSFSRQGILMSAVMLLVCCVLYLIVSKKRERIIGGCMMGGALLLGIIALIIFKDKLANVFNALLGNIATGSDRTNIWKTGINFWLHQPLFGKGFYDPAVGAGEIGFFGGNLSQSIPVMCHNTIVQMLCSCGVVGLIAYVVHRVQTVMSLFKNVTHERVMIALTLCAFLLTCLLDNHIFYFLPTLVYSVLVGYLSATEKKQIEAKKGEANNKTSENAEESSDGEAIKAQENNDGESTKK